MFKHSVPGAVRLGLLSTLAFCSTVSAAETTSTIKVGGPGSCSSEGFNDPGLLADGVTEASADMDFTFDDATGELTLVVTNTSPVLVGVNNPVITQIFFNVPLGITDVQLVDHFSNGGVAPSFGITFDGDLMTNPNQNGAANFGAFSVELRTTNGVNNSIGNPDADTFSPSDVSLSPTTFEMQVTGNYAGLTAEDFTEIFSVIPPGTKPSTGVCHFQAGGEDSVSAFINDSPEQCFLVIGTSTGPGIYSNPGPGINDFALHVDGPFRVFGTTMEYTPYLPVKPLTRPHRVPNTGGFTGTAIGTTSVSQFWAQIVMWNPDVFPGNPEQWSGGLVVTVWDDGTSTAVPFGDSNNIEIDHELVRGPDGRVHVRFPFEIGGL